jgi:uncharacterized protein HemX
VYGYLALLLALGIALAGDYALYERAEAKTAALDAYKVQVQAAQDATAAEAKRRDEASASAGSDMLAYLAAQLPPIEVRTHDAIARVRTIYRDSPVACLRPDGVQQELDAARNRIAAAQG